MRNIHQLIQQLCPDGVEYKRLGDIGDICMCKRVMKNQTNKTAGIPFYKIGTFGGIADAFISEELYKEYKSTYRYPRKGEILLSAAGTVGKAIIFDGQPAYFQDSNIVWVSNNEELVLNKFLYYFYQKNEWQTEGGTIKRLYNSILANTLIPLPPLPVQRAIAETLDRFTQLETELETELECRKKQYEYYRDALLSFDGDRAHTVEWKRLGEIGTFTRGNGLQKKDFTPTGVGCIHYGQIHTHYGTATTETISYCSPELAKKLRKAHKGDLIIATTSEDIKDVCKAVVWLGDEEIVVGGDACIFSHNQDPKYIAYYFQTHAFYDLKKKKSKGTKVIRVSKEDMAEFPIPLPSLSVQRRIVSILDRFESLTTSLTEGLPAEIEARRQQYEYYRDQLLTFKRKEI